MRGSSSQARIVNMSLSACARPVTLMPGPAACPSTALANNVIYIASHFYVHLEIKNCYREITGYFSHMKHRYRQSIEEGMHSTRC